MNSMFWNCTSLTSIDLSNFKLKNNTINLDQTFFGCSSLNYTDISNFVLIKDFYLFDNTLPEKCEIKMNNKSVGKIHTINEGCKITLIYD